MVNYDQHVRDWASSYAWHDQTSTRNRAAMAWLDWQYAKIYKYPKKYYRW